MFNLITNTGFSLLRYNRSWFQHTRESGKSPQDTADGWRRRGGAWGNRTGAFENLRVTLTSYNPSPAWVSPGLSSRSPQIPGCSSTRHENTCKPALHTRRFPNSKENRIFHPRMLESADMKPRLGEANLFGGKTCVLQESIEFPWFFKIPQSL